MIEKTGKPLKEWDKILSEYQAGEKKSNDVVKYLQTEFDVPRYWARTLSTRFTKKVNGEL